MLTVDRIDPAGFGLPFAVKNVTPAQIRSEVVEAILEIAKKADIKVYAAPLFEVDVPRLFVEDKDWLNMVGLLQKDSGRGLVLAPIAKIGIQDPNGNLAEFQLQTDKKARVFIPVAIGSDGPAWGSESGVNLEAGFVYDDLTEPTSHPGKYLTAFSGNGTTTVKVANVEVESFVGLARRSPIQVELTIDAVFDRPKNWELLRYSLRSLNMYAPWIRKIYLVTDDSLPSWLDASKSGIEAVGLGEADLANGLPELAEHFLRVSETALFTHWSSPESFFEPSGLVRLQTLRDPMNIGDPGLGRTDAGKAALALNRWSVERYGRLANLTISTSVIAATKSIEQRAFDELSHSSVDSGLVNQISLSQYLALFEGAAVEVHGDLVDGLVVDGFQRNAEYLNKMYPIPSPWEVGDEDLPL